MGHSRVPAKNVPNVGHVIKGITDGKVQTLHHFHPSFVLSTDCLFRCEAYLYSGVREAF